MLEDVFQAAKSKSVFHVRDPQSMIVLDCWHKYFSENKLPHILRCTNAAMPEKSKEITRGEIMKVFGFLYAMTTVNMSNRRSYWNTEPGLFPAPAFGDRFEMGFHRFEEILKAMRFFDEEEEDEQDKWKADRRFVQACNNI